MPELAEVEDRRQIAAAVLVGRQILGAHLPPDPIVLEGEDAERIRLALLGRWVVDVHRRGKHVWVELDCPPHLLLHFGMTGALRVYSSPSERPAHVVLELLTSDGEALALVMPRRIGRVRLRFAPLAEPPLSELGPEPWPQLPEVSTLRAHLAKKRGTIKGTLLDQRFLAGLGNWLADEILYQAQIAPARAANSLKRAEQDALFAAIHDVVDLAVRVRADETRFPASWLFHRRWGKRAGACAHGGAPLRFDVVAGRTTAWVPALQR